MSLFRNKPKNSARKYVSYQGGFTRENCATGFRIVSAHKLSLEDHGDISAKLNARIDMNRDTIYYWQFIVTSNKFLNCEEIFGVVSDKCDNIGECAFNGLKEIQTISRRQSIMMIMRPIH